MNVENDLEKDLDNLQERVRSIEKSYNPDDLNLHFDIPARADSALFEDLYSVGREAWNIIQINQSWETSYWFYDFFLLISSASIKILNDKTQKYYSNDVIERLAFLLIEISQMTTKIEFQGDIKKRNYEALANLLLAFNNFSNLRNIVIKMAGEMNNQNVNDFVKWAIETVREIENKGTASLS